MISFVQPPCHEEAPPMHFEEPKAKQQPAKTAATYPGEGRSQPMDMTRKRPCPNGNCHGILTPREPHYPFGMRSPGEPHAIIGDKAIHRCESCGEVAIVKVHGIGEGLL